MTKADDKPTILWMSDSWNMATGFGQQTDAITVGLAKRGYKLHLIGHQSSGIRMTDQHGRELISGMGSKFSESAFDTNVKRIKPDIVFTLTDWWNTSYLGNKLRANDYAWIQWLPIDGKPYDGATKWNDTFLAADAIVMLAKFGYNQMTEGVEHSKQHSGARVFPILDWTYHGVYTDIFKPLSNEIIKETREKYEIPDSAVVYVCVGRNQPRKNYPNLIKAWADFVEENDITEDDAVLWIHALVRDSGWDLEFLRDQICENPERKGLNKENFKKTIKFTPDLRTLNDSLSPENLAKMYGMADWFILPTTGEGFGVPTIEAMACGLPVILTDCTTSPELSDNGNNGILVPYGTIVTDRGHMDRFRISIPELTRTFTKTWIDIAQCEGKMWQEKSANALAWARKNCDYEVIIDKWDTFLTCFWKGWKMRQVKEKPKFGDEFNKQYMQIQLINRAGAFAKIERKTFVGILPEKIKTVLDVGCGSGEDMAFFNRVGLFATGCDISDAAIVFCRERGLPVEYADILALNKTYKLRQFDVVWASHVVEHVKDWKKAIKQMWRTAKHVAGVVIPFDNMRDASHVKRYKKEEMQEVKEFMETLPDCEEVYMTPIVASHKPPVSYLIVGYKNIAT